MSKLRVSVSPLTNTIYAGSVLKGGKLWAANKTDVTSDVIGSIIEYVGEDKMIEVQTNGVITHTITVRKIKIEDRK